jgi:hypothetical protein
MAEMKAEIVAVIAKYLPDVDPESIGFDIAQSDRFENKLVAEIPFVQGRERMIEQDENDDLPRIEDESEETLISGAMKADEEEAPKDES